jgi:alkyl hydroperoxide reductase subunit AhpC
MKKSNGYAKSYSHELKNCTNYDKHWTASMPYPTNPFTVVRPSELLKLAKQREKQNLNAQLTGLGEALI